MILDEGFHEEQETRLSDREFFVQIWAKPRQTFRYLLDTKYTKFVVALFVIASIISGLCTLNELSLVSSPFFWVNLAGLIIGNAIFYYFSALMLTWSGNWMEGKATKQDLFIVVTSSLVPIITIGFITFLIRVFVYGGEILFDSIGSVGKNQFQNIVLKITNFIFLGAQIWSLWLVVVGISEAQNFTNGRAIGNIIFAGIVVMFFSWLISIFLMSILSI
ncbi:MAG: YIP1 family protein [Bacteroidota bacterium]